MEEKREDPLTEETVDQAENRSDETPETDTIPPQEDTSGEEDAAQADPSDAPEEEAVKEEDASEEPSEETSEEGEPQEASSEKPEETSRQPSEKKGLFGRKKKDKKDEQIEELKDRLLRQMAEFDNFRKRTDKEKAAMFETGARSVIEKILPVVDNFERGLAGTEGSEEPFVVGMQMIYKQLISTLEAMEVVPIEAVGQPFNSDFHNAVMHVEDENVGENIVVEELQKGYLYRGTVVRYSMVKVAN